MNGGWRDGGGLVFVGLGWVFVEEVDDGGL